LPDDPANDDLVFSAFLSSFALGSPRSSIVFFGRLVGEETREFGVFHDNGGIELNGVEVFFLEAIAGFRRREHFASESNGDAGVLRGDGRFGGERFIEAHDKFGDVVQPRELGMIDDETEKLTGRNMSVDALVLAAFHFEESLVEAEKGEAERK